MKKEQICRCMSIFLSLNVIFFFMEPSLMGISVKAKKVKQDTKVIIQEGEHIIKEDIPVKIESTYADTMADTDHIISNSKGTKQYIVKTEDKGHLKSIQEEYEINSTDSYVSDESLAEENILVADLSDSQAQLLESEDGVLVEQDALMDGAEKAISDGAEEAISDGAVQEYLDASVELAQGDWNRRAAHAEETVDGIRTIRIAVLDSGRDIYADYDVAEAVDFVDLDVDGYAMDISGHGTAVETIIGANHESGDNTGLTVNNNAISMCSVKVLDKQNQAPVSRVIQGIEWCINNDIQIINMSFGMKNYSAILEEEIQKAQDAGILMIASVGNNGAEKEHEVQYPAGYSQVIGVGSVNQEMQRSDFSAYGAGVELMAPGENVPTTYFLQKSAVCNGTSFAAPHVTAIAAMLWSYNGTWSAEKIRKLLQISARNIGCSEEYGYGLVDFACAYEKMVNFDYSEDMEQYDKNEKEVLQYDLPEEVCGLWGKSDHQKLLEKANITDSIIREYITISDDDDLKLKKGKSYRKVLHGNSDVNYVAGVRYLYQAAIVFASSSSKQISDICAGEYAAFSTYESGLGSDEKKAVKEALDYVIGKGITDPTTVGKRTLELAMHAATDVYAHSVYVKSYNAVTNRVSNLGHSMGYYFSDTAISKLPNNIYVGITTRKLKGYAFNDDGVESEEEKIKEKCIKSDFIDNTSFQPDRYNKAAKWAVDMLWAYYIKKEDFSPVVFCYNNTSASSTGYRVQSLSYYITQTFEDLEYPENYNMVSGTGVAFSVWETLSEHARCK